MADLGWTTRSEMIRWTRENIDLDSSTLGKAIVRGYNVARDAIETQHIAPGAVQTDELEDGAVTTVKIADNAVTTAKILAGNVTAPKILVPTLTGASGAAKSLATGALTTYNLFATVEWDPFTMSTGASVAATILAGFAGTYMVTLNWTWAANTTGERQVFLTKNTAGIRSDYRPSTGSSGNSGGSIATLLRLAVNDTIGVAALQNSGGNLNFTPIVGVSFVSI